jgi:hypothetical protein
VFGGGSNAAYAYRYGGDPVFAASPRAASRAFAALCVSMTRYFPSLASLEPAACWTGTLDLTFDRAPSIGTTGERGNVYYALGYSGHGLVLGMQAGRVIADLYAGDHDAWRGFPFYQRRMPHIPPEPLRWVGYQAYTRLTGRSPQRYTGDRGVRRLCLLQVPTRDRIESGRQVAGEGRRSGGEASPRG